MDLQEYIEEAKDEELIHDLKFMETKCFLTGIRGNLTSAYRGLRFFIRPPGEKMRVWLEENNEVVKKPQEYKDDGIESLERVIKAYKSIPYEEMSEENPIHIPLYYGREIIARLDSYLKEFKDSEDKSVLDKIAEEFPILEKIGDKIDEIIKKLREDIKKRTGADYSFGPNCLIRPERTNQVI